MGLAPYGAPKYVEKILTHLIELKEAGSFILNQDYFNYMGGLTMTNSKFEELFGGPRRKPESKLTQKEMDLARSIQEVPELAVVRIARVARKITQSKNLCMAGGVALNCVANGKLLREGILENIWIQPAAGDAGGALGAAQVAFYRFSNQRRVPDSNDSMHGAFLGSQYSNSEIEAFLKEIGAIYVKMEMEEIFSKSAEFLDQGKILGWFQGRMEFGPRSLGARSIFGDPRNPNMQKEMNLRTKFREGFRPFAPAVLKESVSEYFEFNSDSPYMQFVASVHPSIRRESINVDQNLWGIDQLNTSRSSLPAITHIDYSARIQTVDVTPFFTGY